MAELIIITVFTLIGVITMRVVGFGIAPFLAPVALIFFDPPVAIVSTIFVGTLSCVITLYQTRKKRVIIPGVVFRIVIAAIPGLLIGSYIVTRIDKAYLQIITGVVVISAAMIQELALSKPTRPLSVTRGISVSGFFAGLLNSTAANGAPPMAMWLRTHTSTPDQIRQNLAAMFIFVNSCSLVAIYHLKPETYGAQVGKNFLILIPAVLLGNFIGARLIKHVDVKLYEKLVVAAIILTGSVSITLGIVNLLS